MLTIVIVAVLCSLSGANAIMCLNCTESTSSLPGFPTGDGNNPCGDTGGEVVNCPDVTTCRSMSLKYYFTNGNGEEVFLANQERGCGYPFAYKGCMSQADLQGLVNQTLPFLKMGFEAVGYTFERFEGSNCICDAGDECNRGTGPEPDSEPASTEGMAAVGTTPSGASAFLSNMVLLVTSILSAVTFRAL